MSKKRRWRVGNFVWRLVDVPTLGEEDWQLSENQVRSRVKKGEIGTVETLEVSSLDRSWMVRLQPGSQMAMLVQAHLENIDKGQPSDWLSVVTTNIYHVSVIPNGYFHQALVLLLGAYYDPSLLKGGIFNRKAKGWRHDVKVVREAFLQWYEESKSLVEGRGTDDKREEMAIQAEEILGEDK